MSFSERSRANYIAESIAISCTHLKSAHHGCYTGIIPIEVRRYCHNPKYLALGTTMSSTPCSGCEVVARPTSSIIHPCPRFARRTSVAHASDMQSQLHRPFASSYSDFTSNSTVSREKHCKRGESRSGARCEHGFVSPIVRTTAFIAGCLDGRLQIGGGHSTAPSQHNRLLPGP